MPKKLRFLFLTLAVALVGCRSGVILKETPLGLSETRKVIVSVIGETRAVSTNGRELSSKFYDQKGLEIEKISLANERLFTLVSILGDRRPYDIQVEVIIEARDQNGQFVAIGRDDKRALPIAQKIKKALNQSLGSRNLIDDFRTF